MKKKKKQKKNPKKKTTKDGKSCKQFSKHILYKYVRNIKGEL